MINVVKSEIELQLAAKQLLNESPLLELLGKLGSITQTGSLVTSLMVYPDIDLSIQSAKPRLQDAIDIIPLIFSRLSATAVELVDFSSNSSEKATYYIGITFRYGDRTWHVDATIGLPGPINTNPPELASWLQNMTAEQRTTILTLKKELIDARRYAGARSQPPYTFRSVHLYEAVLKGNATTIEQLESYFTPPHK